MRSSSPVLKVDPLRLLVLSGVLLACGCATEASLDIRGRGQPRNVRQCGPAVSGFNASPFYRQTDTTTAGGAAAPTRLSPRALEMADILGARSLVKKIEDLGHATSAGDDSARLRLLQARQQLSSRILLALLEVKSAAAEADCEEERADGLADRLQALQNQRVKYLTILSLVGAGIGSIVSGGLALGAEVTASGIVGIAAGAGEATVGSMALFVNTEHEFWHRRNLLHEVWAGPKHPRLMPVSVWRFINRMSPNDPSRKCLRETLVERWRRDGRLGETGSEDERHRIALFFGSGGTYTIEELRDRANMLDMLEADINLMSHDLEDLLLEVLLLTDS